MTAAVTVYGPPAMVLAVKVGAVAMPPLVVVSVIVFVPPVKMPLAPLPGAVNVTVMPGTGVPF